MELHESFHPGGIHLEYLTFLSDALGIPEAHMTLKGLVGSLPVSVSFKRASKFQLAIKLALFPLFL